MVSLPSERSTRFGNPAWPGFKTANFAAFGAWSGVLPKNAESLRDSDALMRVAAPGHRGPAGLRDLFRFCRNCGLYVLRSGPFRVCEARGGITTLSALYVLLKRRTAACQNGSFAALGSWPGALTKNAESLRNSDAPMRVAVPRRRGPAGLRSPYCGVLGFPAFA